MNDTLYQQIIEALKDRAQGYEVKQEGFYRVRFGGIKRSNKPYPSAPDMHYPLADSTIDKLKPLFVQQLYANETLAQFIATIGQNPADTQSASEWFDYQLKQCSNFEPEIFSGIDQMLECGSVPVKVYFDVDKGMLCFSSCDPMHVVVPPWTENIQDADWLVHILQISESQYRANPNYKQDDDFIKSIKGKADSRDSGDAVKADLVKLREGLAYGQNKDQIVLWEVYRREGGKLVVDTISPIRGCDEPVRETFGFPYDHNKLPFFILPNEITKKGYYSPRGIPELLAPYQMALKKMWDGQLQHLDFHGVPTYKNTGQNPLPNAQNYRSRPGGILPPGIEPTQNPPAPIDFDKQMAMTRAIAEERISIPDLGNNQHLTPGGGQADRVTATQINAVVGLSGQSNDLRARVFRLYLAYGYKMAWDLLVQFKKAELQYILEGEIKQVNSTALHDKYIIMPNGSPDSWNKGGQMQKALMRFQMFKGDPFIKQGELRKTVMELDDSRLVKRLYTDPGAEQEAQAEQQAQEISIMLLGYPAAVSPADDDKTHLMTMAQFVQRRMQQNEPITPELARLFLMHGSQHTEALTEKKDPAVKQISEQLMPVVQILQQISSQPDQPGAGNNVQPPNGAQQPGVPSSSPGAAAAPSPQEQADEQAKIAVQAGNMLINAAKAGIPVSHGELNAIMRRLKLPDLPTAPIPAVTHAQKEAPAEKPE